MRTQLGILVFVIVLLLSLQEAGQALFHKTKAPASIDKLYKKLGVERPEKKILAPDFTLEDLSGKRLSLKNLKGKVVFLNFWATWCIPCREEMPTMEKLYRELRNEGLEIVAIDVMESKKDVREFVEELGLTFTVLLDRDGEVSKAYGAWAIPATHIINRKAELVGKAMGPRQWDSEDAKTFFRELLSQKP